MTLTFQTKAQGPKVAYLFPGQGAQAVGMGKELYDHSAAAREVFDEVDESLGRSLTKVLFEGPEDDLRQTINAQPGIMAVSLACVKAMEENLDLDEMPQPIVMAGHSLGEYSALVAAGAMTFREAVQAVHQRGRFMQSAVPPGLGAMAAVIGLPVPPWLLNGANNDLNLNRTMTLNIVQLVQNSLDFWKKVR